MDWAQVTLFFLILARMSGFILFNPLFGRQSIPGIVKSGFILLLGITAFTMTTYRPAVPDSILELGVRLFLEMGMGYLVGIVMNFFFYIPLLGGETIDIQMGMSMGKTYDPGSQASTTVTASLLNILMMLLFFAANGHHTLIRLFLTSGEVVPFGGAALNTQAVSAAVELFVEAVVLGIKLCMPILAAELISQIGMGILMKVIPQINVFSINIELKVMIGLGMLFILIAPFSEFLLKAEMQMLDSLHELLTLAAA